MDVITLTNKENKKCGACGKTDCISFLGILPENSRRYMNKDEIARRYMDKNEIVGKKEPCIVKERPRVLSGVTYKIKTGMGKLYITVNELNGKPFEVFATIGKSGKSVMAKTEAIGRMVSLVLRSGVSVYKVIDQLKGIGGEHPQANGEGLVLSIPDGIAQVLTELYLKDKDDELVKSPLIVRHPEHIDFDAIEDDE